MYRRLNDGRRLPDEQLCRCSQDSAFRTLDRHSFGLVVNPKENRNALIAFKKIQQVSATVEKKASHVIPADSARLYNKKLSQPW